MAIWEKFESRDRTLAENFRSQAVRTFIVDGTSDDQVAMNTVLSSGLVPGEFRGLKLVDIRLERVGELLWEAHASYADADRDTNDDKPDLGEIVWSFDTGGGTAHISQAKKGNTTSYVGAGNAARDFKGAINVGKDSVDGVDIVVPALKLSATARLSRATITDAWVLAVARLTGKTNNAQWYSFAQGELLFLGASGSQTVGIGNPTITFNFEASENATNLVYEDVNGNEITVATKGGHEYLWISYQDAADATAKAIVQRAHTVFVEKVYEEGDFTILGLGS